MQFELDVIAKRLQLPTPRGNSPAVEPLRAGYDDEWEDDDEFEEDDDFDDDADDGDDDFDEDEEEEEDEEVERELNFDEDDYPVADEEEEEEAEVDPEKELDEGEAVPRKTPADLEDDDLDLDEVEGEVEHVELAGGCAHHFDGHAHLYGHCLVGHRRR